MSATQVLKCDNCGEFIKDVQTAMAYAGTWINRCHVAAGISTFHSCSAHCAVAHIRATADRIEKQAAAEAAAKAATK
jgi:ribosomal protein S26